MQPVFRVPPTRLLASLFLGVLANLPAAATEVPLDLKQSSLTFTGHAFIHDFDGRAQNFRGSAQIDSRTLNLVTSAVIQIETPGLTTLQQTRDRNMRDWLHVDTNPEMVFRLTRVSRTEDEPADATRDHPARFQIGGMFTLNKITRPLEAEAQGWREGRLLVVTGATKIDTTAYGLPIIRQLFMTVDKDVDIRFRLVFDLPPGT